MERETFERFLEIVTITLISLAAIASAWCGYQAARWGGLQAFDYSLANAERVAASEAEERGLIVRVVHVGLFVNYERALFERDRAFAEFLYRRFPPDLRVATDAWRATDPLKNPKAPKSPFAMPQYRLPEDRAFAKYSREASELVANAVAANRRSDDYVYLTVLYASVSFLGGVATKLRRPWNLTLTIVGIVLFVLALVRMLRSPIRW